MIIAPSVLNASYNPIDLEKRFQYALNHHTRFLQLSRQSLPTTWHLDFALPKFSSLRNIRSNISLQEYFKIFQAIWTKSAILQIHLMGQDEDLVSCSEFFENYEFNSDWLYQIFVPEVSVPDWLKYEKDNENVKIGIWYDLDEWEKLDDFDENLYLLMTVKAGQSGQKMTEETKNHALKIVSDYPNANFILDCGWSVDFESDLNNLSIVSDTSFWKTF